MLQCPFTTSSFYILMKLAEAANYLFEPLRFTPHEGEV
jgi:hypothetical protein